MEASTREYKKMWKPKMHNQIKFKTNAKGKAMQLHTLIVRKGRLIDLEHFSMHMLRFVRTTPKYPLQNQV
jgi:hypothetical protein